MADSAERENIFLFVPNLIGEFYHMEMCFFKSSFCKLRHLLTNKKKRQNSLMSNFGKQLMSLLFILFQAIHGLSWRLLHSISCKQITLLQDGVILSVLCWMLLMAMQLVHLIKVSVWTVELDLIELCFIDYIFFFVRIINNWICFRQSDTKFGAMLDQLTDRCGTLGLLVTLSYFYPRYMFWFQMSMVIDIACHWIYMQT